MRLAVSRSRIASITACLAGMLAACLALPGIAVAATPPPTFKPQLTAPNVVRPLFTDAAPQPKTVTADYSCDFSAYGSGIPPATVSVTAETETPWPVNQPDAISLVNDAFDL